MFQPVSRFPASGIDLAFIIHDAVPAAAVVATLRTAGGELLEDVRIFDVFRAETLGAGRRSQNEKREQSSRRNRSNHRPFSFRHAQAGHGNRRSG